MNRLNKFEKKYKEIFEEDSRNIDEKSENSKTVNHIIENKDTFKMKDNLQTVSNKNYSKLTPFNKYIIISKNCVKDNINNINDNTTFFNNDSNKKNSINYINNIDLDINGISSERKLNNFKVDNSNEIISLFNLNKKKINKYLK